jgi:hypothetical protein
MPELTEREWQLLQAMRAHKTPQQIAADWGITRAGVDNCRRKLEHKGVIRRRGDLPLTARYTEDYPWTFPGDLDIRYRPAIPPTAEFRVKYATDSRRDMTVPPIRFVRWDGGGVTVQGIPVCRPDGQEPYTAVPEDLVVWVVADAGPQWVFVARRGRWWLESWTCNELHRVADKQSRVVRDRLLAGYRVEVTQLIAAAIGAHPVLDLTETAT